MTRKATVTPGSAAERILETASDLFYRQGYRATGINEVIEKSGVAKATFYKHFPTKDDLCLRYLRERNLRELSEIQEYVGTKSGPLERFLAVIESLEPWMVSTGMKGCGFLNMVPEVPDTRSPLRMEGASHYSRLRNIVRVLADELVQSNRERYGHLDAQALADDYMVIFTGSVALAEISHEMWPIRQGLQTVKRLIS